MHQDNAQILKDRIRARENISGVRVGDYIDFGEDAYRRVAFKSENFIQPDVGAGSYHIFKNGGTSMSGSLESSIDEKHLQFETDSSGSFWFFDMDMPGAHRGIDCELPCRVYRYTGPKPDWFKRPTPTSLRALRDIGGKVHRDLSLTVLATEQGCNYKFLVRNKLSAFKAFQTKEALLGWLDILHMLPEEPVPDFGSYMHENLDGMYGEKQYSDLSEFNAIDGIPMLVMSNGSYDMGKVTYLEDDSAVLHCLRSDAKGRKSYDYHQCQKKINNGDYVPPA